MIYFKYSKSWEISFDLKEEYNIFQPLASYHDPVFSLIQQAAI